MRNSNTNNWRSTALIAGAILTAGVVTTTSTTNAHADDSQNNAQVSSNLSTYDQVRATADTQLAQLQSANDSKEAQQATANEQSNAADLAQVNAQIDQLNASHAALEQKEASAIAQAQAETAASIAQQTSAANNEYQQQINAQQQNEATQQVANDQQYAQAVSQNAEKQEVANGINAQYQKAVSEAASTAADQNKTATDDYNDAVAKANNEYQSRVSAQNATNEASINNAQVELNMATSKAQQPHTEYVGSQKTVNGRVAQPITNVKVPAYVDLSNIPLEVKAYDNNVPFSAYEHPEFALTYAGEYSDGAVITNGTEASTPHDINEMPLTFKPGLLTYNANEDHSEEVPASGLTASQIQTLRALVNAWTNGFRNEVFTNYRAFYNAVNSGNGFKDVAPLTVVSTNVADRVADEVSAARSRYNIDNNHHSTKANGMPTKETYGAYLNKETTGLFDKLNGVKDFNVLPSENLTTMVAGKKRTLLNYALNLYNSMQGMYYGELVTPQAIGGHAYNILRGDIRLTATGFQKLSDAMLNTGDNKWLAGRNNPVYAVTFNNISYNVDNNAAETKAFANDSAWGTSTINSQLNAIKSAQSHVETVHTATQVQPTAEEVNQATMVEQQKLAYTKDQAQQALDALANDHQANLTKLEQQYNAAKDQIKANYNKAVATAESVRANALKANNLVDLQAYKAQLDAAYQNLVKADQVAAEKLAADRDAKINNIKKTENEKLAAKIEELVPSVQPQIQELMNQHRAVVAHGDAILEEMRAAHKAAYAKLEQQFNDQLVAIQQREAAKNQNKVQLANATVVLPAQSTNNNSVRTVSASRVQPVATQTAPVVTAASQAVANAVTAPVATMTTPAATVNNQATTADNSKKSSKATKKGEQTTAMKQTTKKEATKKVNQSSMSIVALAATALVGAAGLTYSSKKRHN